MGKKSLGRGLDDIADMFLSTRTDKKMQNGFSSKKLRDATCESCRNIIDDSNNTLKCKIFTLQNKNYGVRYMNTISLQSGSYCEYFEPSVQMNAGSPFVVKETSSDHTEINCAIEESVSIQRSVAHPNTPEAQQDILKSLSRHLEENYSIRRIELRRTDRVSQPGMKKITDESVTIFINGGVDNGNHS
ncbi:MAG: hypothetical protein JRE65_17255 [Deltaproteobacteria bacterium]|jgi:hypothetical protein|nr:hypothetical protein [Deltaproteobacteria bacterium]